MYMITLLPVYSSDDKTKDRCDDARYIRKLPSNAKMHNARKLPGDPAVETLCFRSPSLVRKVQKSPWFEDPTDPAIGCVLIDRYNLFDDGNVGSSGHVLVLRLGTSSQRQDLFSRDFWWSFDGSTSLRWILRCG